MVIKLTLMFYILVESGRVLVGGSSIFREDYEFSSEINSYYKLHEYPQSWVNARTRCADEGAQLFTPANNQEANFVKSLYDSLWPSFNGIYLGLNAYFSKGDFASIEEKRILDLYNVWNDEEPNNLNDNENCAVMTRTGKYSDVACEQVFPFLCARPETGLTWNSACNTYDTVYKACPGSPSCYKIHTDPRNWTDAYATCKAEGGYLAIVKTNAQKNCLVQLFDKHPVKSLRGNFYKGGFFIGFHDLFVVKRFEYIDGTRVPWEKFDPKEPNSDVVWPNQRCGAMYRTGLFDDNYCKAAAFVCERPVSSSGVHANPTSPNMRGG